MTTQLEREEQYLEEQYASGDITLKELQHEMNELQRERRARAEEAAQEAYDNEMNRW